MNMEQRRKAKDGLKSKRTPRPEVGFARSGWPGEGTENSEIGKIPWKPVLSGLVLIPLL